MTRVPNENISSTGTLRHRSVSYSLTNKNLRQEIWKKDTMQNIITGLRSSAFHALRVEIVAAAVHSSEFYVYAFLSSICFF